MPDCTPLTAPLAGGRESWADLAPSVAVVLALERPLVTVEEVVVAAEERALAPGMEEVEELVVSLAVDAVSLAVEAVLSVAELAVCAVVSCAPPMAFWASVPALLRPLVAWSLAVVAVELACWPALLAASVTLLRAFIILCFCLGGGGLINLSWMEGIGVGELYL